MSQALAEILPDLATDWETAIENMITEDDEPVDSIFAGKQQRLLVESLYSSWQPAPFEDAADEKRTFWAESNVGVFASPYFPAIAPDMFLSLDVIPPEPNLHDKETRSYFLWKHDGKAPEIVVEIISDKRGDEFGKKMEKFGRMGVNYYITFDPRKVYDEPSLRVYERTFAWRYRLREDLILPEVGLILAIWRGEYEGMNAEWMRWCDADGNLILTAVEGKQLEAERADAEAERANAETERADAEAAARRQAEAEIERLKIELARLQGGKSEI